MQSIGDLFNILLFVTVVGSLLSLLFCLWDKVLRLRLPLWFGACCMAAYIAPITAPGTWLVPPEEHGWVDGYSLICRVWIAGVLLLILLRAIRSVLGYQALKSCRSCQETRILDCCGQCARLMGLRKVPAVFYGALKNPACVLGILHPAVILDETAAGQLTAEELMAVLSHEMTHIRRMHLALESVFDYVCILHWFNPFTWIMRREFSSLCEVDCDRHALAALTGRVTPGEYAHALLRLLTLSSDCGDGIVRGMGALNFLSARRRIRLILSGSGRPLRIAGSIAASLGLTLAIALSLHMSRGYFYPYQSGPAEYAAEYDSFLPE